MKCKYCGKEFDKKGLLLAHYRDHKRGKVDENDFGEDVEIEEIDVQEKSIPADWCPNAEYLGNNKTICMRVLGIKKGNKIFITQIDII